MTDINKKIEELLVAEFGSAGTDEGGTIWLFGPGDVRVVRTVRGTWRLRGDVTDLTPSQLRVVADVLELANNKYDRAVRLLQGANFPAERGSGLIINANSTVILFSTPGGWMVDVRLQPYATNAYLHSSDWNVINEALKILNESETE